MRTILDSNKQVAHYFANNIQAEGRGSNFFFENDRLYSYGKHFCVARRLPNGVIALTTQSRSNSTAKHLCYARGAMSHLRKVYCYDPGDSTPRNKAAAQQQITEELDKAATSRRIQEKTRDAHRAAAYSTAQRFNEYLEALPAEEVGQVRPFDLTSDGFVALHQARIAQAAREVEERKQAEQRRAEVQRETLAAWCAGERVRSSMFDLPVALRLHSYDLSAVTNLAGVRIYPDAPDRQVIQTSHGAEIPVDDALKLWPLIGAVRAGRVEPGQAVAMCRRLGVYTLNEITAQGDIRVGCHNIAYSEIEKMARLLGLMETAT